MPLRRTPSPGYDPRREGVTQGLLSRWLACKNQARFGIQMWSGYGTTTSIFYGDLVHAALARLYTEATEGHVDLVGSVVDAEYAVLAADRGAGLWTAEQTESFELCRTQATAVLRVYFRHWEKRHGRMQWEKTEEEFAVDFAGVKLRGKLDGVLLYPGKGKRKPTRWLFETKTRGMNFDGNLEMMLHRDLQANLYLLALRLLGKEPYGVLYNEIRRPQLKLLQGRGKNPVPETIEQYEARVEADAAGDTTKYFRRLEVAVPRQDLDAFATELTQMLVEFTAWWKAGMPGWKYGMPCMGKYGACPYLRACHEDDFDGLTKKKQMYMELSY
jgi:hypothetical protein